jgi:hypothetical protein
MIDIVRIVDGEDIGLYDTDVERAKNILSVQEGALTYLPDFGIDLKYFLSEEFEFQNESFKSYCVQRLASYSVNVSSVVETLNALYNDLVFNIGAQNQTGSSMVAR